MVPNPPLTCDDNGAGDGQRSRLLYNGHAGVGYAAVVESVGGPPGVARINLQLGSAPAISLSNQARAGYLGSRLLLEAGIAPGSPPPNYRWFWNGAPVPGGTNASLSLPEVSTALAGTYSVIASNFAGMVTNLAAVVTVGPPLALSIEGEPARLMLRVLGDGGMSYRLLASPTLASDGGPQAAWEIRRAGRLPADGRLVLDEGAAPAASRFYRIVLEAP